MLETTANISQKYPNKPIQSLLYDRTAVSRSLKAEYQSEKKNVGASFGCSVYMYGSQSTVYAHATQLIEELSGGDTYGGRKEEIL